jgi:hypothetical protein
MRLNFWKGTKKAKAKTKRKVQDPEKMFREYQRLLLRRERFAAQFNDEAWKLEKKRQKEGQGYLR